MIRKAIEAYVRRLGKHPDFTLHPSLDGRTLLGLLTHVAVSYIRGWTLRVRAGKTNGLVLLGRGVRIRNPAFLTYRYSWIKANSTAFVAAGMFLFGISAITKLAITNLANRIGQLRFFRC